MGNAKSKPWIETGHEVPNAVYFEKKQVREWHRGFAGEFPQGYLMRRDMHRLYSQFFPFGNSMEFSNLVFDLLDSNRDGRVSFAEFVDAFWIVARGNLDDKIKWSFRFYDLNGDGIIEREEMSVVVEAIYNMIPQNHIPEETAESRVEKIFSLIDKEHIERQDYYLLVKSDPAIVHGLFLYDGLA